jgi:hypothetical protein
MVMVTPTLEVRHPKHLMYIAGNIVLPKPIDITITRGLDQELGTCVINYPYPLPPSIAYWQRISVLIGVTYFPDPGLPQYRTVQRFVGYITGFSESLYPGAVAITCEDVMVIAKHTYTPTAMELTNETDVSAIKRILGRPEQNVGGCGIGTSLPFEGNGKFLADDDDTELFWDEDRTALEQIQQIDETSMGYRTMQMADGRVIRRFLDTNPKTEQYVHHYQEGVDIIEGTATSEIVSPLNTIQVTGFDLDYELHVPADQDPFDWMRNSYWIRWLFLRHQGPFQQALSITDSMAWLLSQLEKRIIKLNFSSHLPILYQGIEVIRVTSARLNVSQNFWVQSVQEQIDSTGQYTQTITCVSELIREKQRPVVVPPVIPPINVTPGQPSEHPITEATPDVAPSAADLLVGYSIDSVERELATPATVAGNEGFIYTIHFTDTSTSRQGTIVSRSWSAEGTVGPSTGTQDTFIATFTSLEDSNLTLTVTDSNGSTASLEGPVQLAGVPVTSRKLYACTDTTYEAFDGTQWRSQEPVSAPSNVTVVAGGPWWGAGNFVAYSADDLATPAVEVAALPGGEDIISIWKHESVEGDVAVGGNAGSVAISHDKGATWTQVTSPGSAVNFIIVSIFDANEVHVVTPEGWLKSQDGGQNWNMVRAGNFKYLELSHTRNIVVTSAGVLQRGEDGTPFTGNTSPIVAATAHIRQDKFYAIAEDGTTWIQDAEGSYTLVAGEPIPAGEPYTAGAYRDGLQVDLVYFAAQDGGLYKTLDGFRTPEGYMRLRTVGELTP